MARARLRIIKKLLSKRKRVAKPEKAALPPRLLDIGCAYGAFLSAARDEGFDGTGVDVSEAAAAYTSGKLGIPAFAASFPGGISGILPGGTGGAAGGGNGGSFDCLTMWFVIEHLQDVPAAFAKARELLSEGGVFAFSTPSGAGISARKDLKKFLESSPADHWSVWKPAACRRLPARYGFRVKKIRVTGHHPERFPVIGVFAGKHRALYTLLLAVSKLFRLGDTFEVYCVAGGGD
jgi:2-polyprenyl-3-methyl-5-hydroxy-6-metoxy-1,4-benzoquinol methylase